MSKADIFDSIHHIPPSSEPYGLRRRLNDRIFVRGLLRETRVLLSSLATASNTNKRFLIVARARSGTKLLTRLLDSHSRIHCDREVFNRNVIAPAAYFDRLAGKVEAEAYGAKILSDHMVIAHRMYRPDKVFGQMAARGVHLIHLERSSLMQAISSMVAGIRGQLHSDRGAQTLSKKTYLSPPDFVQRLRWTEALLEYEKAALKDLPHLHISYEQGLLGQKAQNETVARVCDLLDLPVEEVAEPLKKLLPNDAKDIIENYDEVRSAVIESGLAHLLPEA